MEAFVVKRVVSWGDCDPAGVVFMPRLMDFAVEAAEKWYLGNFGYTWLSLRRERGIGSPMVKTQLDIMAPAEPGDELALTVRLKRVGSTSVTYQITGAKADGTPCFKAEMVQVSVEVEEFKSVAIPEPMRTHMQAYHDACPA